MIPANDTLWNATLYDDKHSFVFKYGEDVVQLLASREGERILDLGCGTGHLTNLIAKGNARVTGVDKSASMIEKARAAYPDLDFRVMSATDLHFDTPFDAVFSNAALHWIPSADQPASLSRIHRALRRGGRFVAEMGGHGNIAAIRTALQAVLAPFGIDAEAAAASFFPSPGVYTRLLEAAGFSVQSIELIPRPTPLPNGMDSWLNTFRNGVLDQLKPVDRATALGQTLDLLEPVLRDADGNWTADYVRLRFHARKL